MSGLEIFQAPSAADAPALLSGAWRDVRDFVGGSTGVAAVTANSIYASPVYLAVPTRVDGIGINIPTTPAGTTGRLMIFKMGANGLAGDLALDAGIIDPSTIGDKILAIDLWLPAGFSFPAVVFNGAAQPQTVSTTMRPLFGTATPASTTPRCSLVRTNADTSAPASFGTPTSYSSIYVRVALRAV